MNYRQINPSAATASFVECYWVLEDNFPSSADIQSGVPRDVQRIVPDGCSELILNLGTPFETPQDGQWRPQPESFFVGQITRPMLVRPGGPAKVLGVRFRPHGASRVLRLPMNELTELAVPLRELSAKLHRELAPLPDLGTTPQQLAHVNRTLQLFVERGSAKHGAVENDLLVACAVNHLMLNGETDIAALAVTLGLSSRQFQRRFKTKVGIAPKLFSRIQRFQRVFHALDFSSQDWVNVAVESGYYDQSHLIRDFQDFSGEPPAALLSPQTDLAFHFLRNQSLQNKSMSYFSKTSALPAT
jgi:AraC-like DNA-binding protein